MKHFARQIFYLEPRPEVSVARRLIGFFMMTDMVVLKRMRR
jgi:hypothetical protein